MFARYYIERHPEIITKLRKAKLKISPEKYVGSAYKNAFLFAIILTFAAFLFFSQTLEKWMFFLIFVVIYFLMFNISIRKVDIIIKKRAREIDREVVYAGRFLLIKLSAGKPLLNTLIDASNSYGVGSKYFKEIVKDIELGNSVEKAITNAMIYSPSEKFKKILFQISNALKAGIDVTKFLEAIVDDIEKQQLIEIERYGKKLNSVTLMYMLFGIVIPSLGISMISVVGTLTGLEISSNLFILMIVFVVIIQSIFLMIFRSIRPDIAI